MKPDLTYYYYNSLLPLKIFLYFPEKKQPSTLPNPKRKNKKIYIFQKRSYISGQMLTKHKISYTLLYPRMTAD